MAQNDCAFVPEESDVSHTSRQSKTERNQNDQVLARVELAIQHHVDLQLELKRNYLRHCPEVGNNSRTRHPMAIVDIARFLGDSHQTVGQRPNIEHNHQP
jgi:hypothetical protein